MLCVRCKKRTAVVFVQRMDGGKPVQEGYCLTCARELHIQPVDDLMKRFGMSDDDLANMEERVSSFLQEAGQDPDALSAENGELPDEFVPGGSPTFPFAVPAEADKEGGKSKKKRGRGQRKYLDGYCENLTQKAREGRLDNIIGRDREVYRTIQILCRRQKNNPCLIGEAGVGKTAIAEGIAQRIAAGKVPARLQDKEIYLLDLTALVAGTQFRGQFEQRVKGLLSEIKAEGNVILFIDEIHNIVGAGDSDGAMNAANIMKPALSRGQIQVIGATTFAEYRKYIEKDSALERRFQPVKVEEPTINDAIEVIRGVKGYYEKYHCVKVPDAVAADVVRLSERYITDRYLPDKAIDLLDEACACCNLRHPEITEYLTMQKQVADLEEKEHTLENPDPEGDSAIDYEELAKVKTELAQMRQKLPALELRVADICVTPDDIAQVVELWTGIPAVKIKESEYGRLLGLEDALKAHIIGQDEAVHSVAQAIKRTRADLSGRHRPASFLFVGPTGVGKTELVKQLASQLFDTVDPLISIDMSEYMEKYAVSRLIGSPPGYVGYDEAGQLTEKVRRHPYSVVLFDEIEKAHPDVMNILLQILDEGKINDAQGRVVDFSNTVICMTSNAGSSDRTALTGFGRTIEETTREKSLKALQEFLRPEFLGRVDEIITFRPLDQENLEKIAALMLEEYRPGFEARGLTLSYTPQALTAIVAETPTRFGAWELRKTIRKTLEDPVAEAVIAGKLSAGQTVTVEADENGKPVLRLPS
ncbi:MAG: ATP-dependent Clp protease ATP-binding subunit [Gemmiger sp.]|uniref:ATP-dependent Clp protease ATP-binding subunit n=1 Tax=Gemmiger sp. TaxID=2049027 RepID=UPI002E793F93|nr:ATP-dependent Clp protease ATP-binding subunit [Gemmiger sp.]MEE0799647.1 ATP-dependent Clp protease ATP-binding subunit [Gemmiger sp.]